MLGLIALCLLAPGCQLAWDAASNLAFETCLFTDHVTSNVYYYHLAGNAWRDYRTAHPDKANDQDFVKGFKRGYTEYLEDGGVAGTPPLPPQRYWKTCYQSPEGRAATIAWYAGYREGSLAAKASGYRNLIVVPAGKGDPPAPPGGPGEPGAGMIMPGPMVAPIQTIPAQPIVPSEPDLPAPRLAPSTGNRP
jgi:hypothetical protein